MGFQENSMTGAAKKRYFQTACFGVPEYEMVVEFTYRPRIGSEHMQKGGESNELSKTHDSR